MNCFCFPCQPASCVYECVFARIADENLYACSCVWQTKKLLCNFKCVPLQVQLTVHFRFLPGKLCTSALWQDLSQEPTCLQLRPMHFSRFSLSFSLSVSESVQQSSHICQKMCLSFVSLTMHYSGSKDERCTHSAGIRQLPYGVAALKLPSHTRFGTWTLSQGLPHDNVQMSQVHITSSPGMKILKILKVKKKNIKKIKLLKIVVMRQRACLGNCFTVPLQCCRGSMCILMWKDAWILMKSECFNHERISPGSW